MLELDEQIVDVLGHAESAALARITSADGNAGKFVPGHVALDTMVFLEKIQKKVEVFDSNIFYTKVISDEAELEGTPFVAPEARRGGCFIESFSKEAGTKKITGKDTSLGKLITALLNFKIDAPSRSRPPRLYSVKNLSGMSEI
jgi:hypothetical protein